MGHRWLDDTALVRVFLDVDDRVCRHCGAKMHVCDHRRHRIETLEGQRKIVCRLVKCIDRTCPGNHRTVSPESEAATCHVCLVRSLAGMCFAGSVTVGFHGIGRFLRSVVNCRTAIRFESLTMRSKM